MKLIDILSRSWVNHWDCSYRRKGAFFSGALGVVVFLLGWIVLAVPEGHAQIVERINFQGRLLDGTNLVTGVRTIQFYIYTNAVGGSYVYTEKHSVPVVDGFYAVQIGASNSVPGSLATLFTNANLYVEVAVEGESLLPRHQLGAVGRAVRADSVSRNAITASMLDSGVVYANQIAFGQVVKGINGLTDNITIEAGEAMEIMTNGTELVLDEQAGWGTAQRQAMDFTVVDDLAMYAGDVACLVGERVRHGWWAPDPTWLSDPLSGPSSRFSCRAMDSNRFVSAWYDMDGDVVARIAAVSNMVVTFGSIRVLSTNAGVFVIEALNTNQFVCAYENDDDLLVSSICTVTGGLDFVVADESVLTTNIVSALALTALDTNRFAVCYWKIDGFSTFWGEGAIGFVDADTQTVWGTPAIFVASNVVDTAGGISCDRLSAYRFVVIHNTSNGMAAVGNRGTGDSLNWSDNEEFPVDFYASAARYWTVVGLSADAFAVAGIDNHIYSGDESLSYVFSGDYNIGDITYGEVSCFAREATRVTGTGLSTNEFLLSLSTSDSDASSHVIKCALDGGIIDVGYRHTYESRSDISYSPALTALDASHFVVGGFAGGGKMMYYVLPGVCGHEIGIAQETRAGGEICRIAVGGMTDMFDAVVPGRTYRDNGFGNTTADRNNYWLRLGRAVSTNEILLELENE